MKKSMKKFASIILVLAMTLSMTIIAFAEETGQPQAGTGTYTIKISNTHPGHIFEAYQIFSGDLHGDVLSNIEWGTGITDDGKAALGDAVKKAATLPETASTATVEAFAEEVAQYLSDIKASSTEIKGADGTLTDHYEISGLEPGYYLIKDKDESQTGGENSRYTKYIMKVVNNVEVSTKGSVPTVIKKVKGKNDSTGVDTGWQDHADYDIGDQVPFQLTATMPNNLKTYYKSYKIIFKDTLSKGLTYDEGSYKVFLQKASETSEERTDVTSFFTPESKPNNDADQTSSLTFTCNNVLDLGQDSQGNDLGADSQDKIIVEYTATLNSNAVIGGTGNPNEVYLEYSNNPNSGGEGDTGKTPKDIVTVFTFNLIVNKVTYNTENKETPLAGAEFTLSKWIFDSTKEEKGFWQVHSQPELNDAKTSFTFKGLDVGKYKLEETKTPAGYNTIDPITFEVSAQYNDSVDPPTISTLSFTGKMGEASVTMTSNKDTGIGTTTIVNRTGSTLPSTGGMGTTIFYIIGGILVVGAVILFITKRRMNIEK